MQYNDHIYRWLAYLYRKAIRLERQQLRRDVIKHVKLTGSEAELIKLLQQ